jgi:hypothetical protein
MTDLRLILSSSGRLTARALPYLPGTLVGGAGIDVVQVGTTYTIAWNATEAGFSAFGMLLGAAADAVAAQALLAIAPRIITVAGLVTVTATDAAIILNKTLPTPTTIQLPFLASRQGLPILISDFNGNGGEIIIVPTTGERVGGLAVDAPWVIGSGGNDSHTKVLLYLNGADASTTITDDNAGGSAHTWTANGNAQIDTAQSKFGGASLLCDGTGDYVSTPDHADFTLGSGDWTIDCWFNVNVAGGSAIFLAGQSDAAFGNPGYAWSIIRTAGNVMKAEVAVGAALTAVTGTTQFTNAVNTGWHHIAFVRTGATLKLFVDGVQEGGNIAISGTINNSASNLSVGRIGEVLGTEWNGWIDQFRLSVGVARWVDNSRVPLSEYMIPSGGSSIRLTPVAGVGWAVG